MVNFAYISACAHESSVCILSEKRTLCGAAVLENFRVGLVVNDASDVLLLNEELYAAVTCYTPFDVFDFVITVLLGQIRIGQGLTSECDHITVAVLDVVVAEVDKAVLLGIDSVQLVLALVED